MTSSIAWLDTSAEQRRRANEIIALFMQAESRDELGIGTVRDAFSNLLFPGTSVLLTRARYCLFVPWCFRSPSVVSKHGQDHLAAAERAERYLIDALRDEETDTGVIGRVAGRDVRNLPSTIYWGTLNRWGITPRTSRSLLGRAPHQRDVATELDERADADWQPDLPRAPKGFPYTTGGGFALREDEAEWLRDRILAACAGTALAELLTLDMPPKALSAARGPWDVPALAARPDVRQADLFSLAIQGANLVYNLCVAERCERMQLTKFDGLVERYRAYLHKWGVDMTNKQDFATWDVNEMWSYVEQAGQPPHPTRLFVNHWITLIREADVTQIADNKVARSLVAERERRKGQQSRLINDKMLPTWSGASAVGRLNFRWTTIHVLAHDIREGLESREGQDV